MTRRLALTLACALLASAALAQGASAASYTVNTSADAPDLSTTDPTCDSSPDAGLQCTLRAAIQQSNSTTGGNEILFEASLVGGNVIQLTGALPAIEDGFVSVHGCDPFAGATQPCVGVRGQGTGTVFSVHGPDTRITGLAITGGTNGLFGGSGAHSLSLHNNWIGVRLSGSPDARTGWGISASGTNVQIGGTSRASRNVVANNFIGIIANGNNATIQGNYIGTMPDGFTQGANGTGIEMRGFGLAAGPSGGLIGGPLSPAAQGTDACDGACNLISGNSFGIDLGADVAGSSSPANNVTIAGNHIGLNTNGGGLVPSGLGIDVRAADDVTIGGTTQTEISRRNVIAVGGTGIRTQAGADNLRIRVNHVGTNVPGTAKFGQLEGNGMEVYSPPAAPAQILNNLVAVGGQTGIKLSGRNALVDSNWVGVASNGTGKIGSSVQGSSAISISDSQAGRTGGNTVSSNIAGNAEFAAVKLEGTDANTLVKNTIGTWSGAENHGAKYGVYVAAGNSTGSTGNKIGGDAIGEQNLITNSTQSAIGVAHPITMKNTVGRVGGWNNAGPFIDIGINGPGNGAVGPQEGVDSPKIAVAGTEAVTGTGKPGSRIRVYVKQTASPGEINGMAELQGTVTVAADGVWTAAYGAQPAAGVKVFATQTTAGGSTSELSDVATTVQSSGQPGTPDTSITGPAITNDTTPTVEFSSDRPGAGYLCQTDTLDAWQVCPNPYTVPRALSEGNHVVRARAVDNDGAVDPTFASLVIAIDTTPPPAPVITGGPEGETTERRPAFSFQWENGSQALCRIDDLAPTPCEFTYTPPADLPAGPHAFSVSARDSVGNQSNWTNRDFTVRIATPPPGDPGNGGGVGGAKGATPETTIVKRPRAKLFAAGAGKTKAKLKFTSSVKGSTFVCRVDRRPARPCASPLKLKLRRGKHRIAVQAVSPAGVADPSPATVRVRVIAR